MRIDIRSEECNLSLALPTRALFSGTAARLAGAALHCSEKAPDLTSEQLHALFRCMRECRRLHPGLVLVEVDAADGTHVLVRL